MRSSSILVHTYPYGCLCTSVRPALCGTSIRMDAHSYEFVFGIRRFFKKILDIRRSKSYN